MAVTSETSSVSYTGNNSAVTAYTVPFLFYKKEHLEVIVTDEDGVETELALTTDYTVTGEGDEDGGTLTTEEAWDNTHTVTIRRSALVLQPFVFEEGQRLPMKTLEKALDWITMHVQRVLRIATSAASDLLDHIADTDNPHAVTKAQVGLGNCDNTSDANKPISTATQTALDGKSDVGHTHTFASLTDKPTTLAGYGITDGGEPVIPITRTAAEGDPNIPDTITATGSMVGASLDPIPVPTVLTRVADVNDFPAWEGDNSSTLQRVGGEWILDIGGGDYLASNDLTEALHPGGMTGWTIDTGSGQPTLTQSAVTATHHGQKCVVGTVNPVVYQALNSEDLTEWTLVGPYGVVSDNENPLLYRRIIFDGGALSSQTYTPADS